MDNIILLLAATMPDFAPDPPRLTRVPMHCATIHIHPKHSSAPIAATIGEVIQDMGLAEETINAFATSLSHATDMMTRAAETLREEASAAVKCLGGLADDEEALGVRHVPFPLLDTRVGGAGHGGRRVVGGGAGPLAPVCHGDGAGAREEVDMWGGAVAAADRGGHTRANKSEAVPLSPLPLLSLADGGAAGASRGNVGASCQPNATVPPLPM